MAAPKQRVCGLDIRKDAICMAQYSLEEPAITSVVVQPLDTADAGDQWWKLVASEIKKLAADGDLKGADVVCSLPFESAVIKNLSVDKDEVDVDAAIAWEMSQHVLGTLDEYAFDYQKLAATDGTVDHYLVVAYRSEAVKRLGNLVKAQRMHPLAVDLDMFGLVNAFEANYGEAAEAPAALVFAEIGRLSVVLTHKGAFVDSETEARSLDPDRPEGVAVAVREALARLRRASPGAFAGSPPRLYGAGPLLCADGFGNALVRQVPGFEVLSPFRKIPARIGNIREEDVRKFAPQLAVAVGLAIRGGAEISS